MFLRLSAPTARAQVAKKNAAEWPKFPKIHRSDLEPFAFDRSRKVPIPL